MIWPADYTLTTVRNGGPGLIAGFLDSHCLTSDQDTTDFCLCVLGSVNHKEES